MSIRDALALGLVRPQGDVIVPSGVAAPALPGDTTAPESLRVERVRSAPASLVSPLAPPDARGMHVPARFVDAAFFAIDEYFAFLDVDRSSLGHVLAADYEAELFDRADEAIEALQDPTVSADVRTAAAHYLLYVAMFIKVGNDEANAGRLNVDQLRRRLCFDADAPEGLSPGRALRREVVARERFALALLQLVATVDRREILDGFIATTRARAEIDASFLLGEETFTALLAEDDSMFNLISTLAGVRASDLSQVQRAEIFARLSSVMRTSSTPERSSLAPWAVEVALVLIADACVRQALDEAGDRMPLALMFESLGPAISMYERALTSTAGEEWALRPAVEARLEAARALRARLFGDTSGPSFEVLRERIDATEAIDLGRCASCHRSR